MKEQQENPPSVAPAYLCVRLPKLGRITEIAHASTTILFICYTIVIEEATPATPACTHSLLFVLETNDLRMTIESSTMDVYMSSDSSTQRGSAALFCQC